MLHKSEQEGSHSSHRQRQQQPAQGKLTPNSSGNKVCQTRGSGNGNGSEQSGSRMEQKKEGLLWSECLAKHQDLAKFVAVSRMQGLGRSKTTADHFERKVMDLKTR